MVEHRSPKPGVAGSSPFAPAKCLKKCMKNIQAAQFIREVKQETSKVTWTSRKDVLMSTIMVLIMVTLAALFFLAVDTVLLRGVQLILGLGS